jgi:3-oxoacyl-[acyl-carrier protein] reductase
MARPGGKLAQFTIRRGANSQVPALTEATPCPIVKRTRRGEAVTVASDRRKPIDYHLDGKVAFVMGGSRGIGLGVSRALAASHARVAIAARTAAGVDRAVDQIERDGGHAIGLCADLSEPDNFDPVLAQIAQRLGPPDIAVFNPPTPPPGALLDIGDELLECWFRILVSGFVRMTRLVVPAMRDRQWGRIVTIGSASIKQPIRGQLGFAYAVANTTRLAAASASKTLSYEVAPFGVTVNTIATGSIDTETGHQYYAARAEEAGVPVEEFAAARIARIPVGRIGSTDEIGSLCAFLCSDLAGFTTGETVLCDGGLVNCAM